MAHGPGARDDRRDDPRQPEGIAGDLRANPDAGRRRPAGGRDLPPRRAEAGRRLARDRGVGVGGAGAALLRGARTARGRGGRRDAASASGAVGGPPLRDVAAAARRRMLAGLPVTERRVSAGGTSTTVLEAGGGPPLVLLHGGIECGGAYWAPVITQLAERHRVVIPDVPGLGASEPLDDLGAEAFAGWLRDLLQITGTERPTLVAHSLVGTLAARFAARDASALRRLIASCTKQVAEAELRRIAVPTELVWGRHDRFVPLALAEAASTRLGWPLRVIERSGHVPHIERPDDFLEVFS